MATEPTELHTKKNRGGRPPERGETKRAPISMRITPTTRSALEAAAARDDRSLAQEIEQRLERSIAQEEAYSPDTFDALDAIRALMERTHERIGASWSDDLTAWEIVADGVVELLLAFKPSERDVAAPPRPEWPPEIAEKLAQYERDRDTWERADKAAGAKIMRAMLKARSGHVLDDAEAMSGQAGRDARAASSPPPVSPLNVEQQQGYDARRGYDRQVSFARAYASHLAAAVRRRREEI